MKRINPVDIFFWTVRRNEKDVINLYSSLSSLMRSATGGDMLNFGLWDETHDSPILAQQNLCMVFGEAAKLDSGQQIADVGGGFTTPAMLWNKKYPSLKITSIDLNFGELRESGMREDPEIRNILRINATARTLPLGSESQDRVLALESPQHFKPLGEFLSESYRVLKKDGLLALAIPVVEKPASILQLGILSMAWSSEHYSVDFVKSSLEKLGFSIMSIQRIGSKVYPPLADYYLANRNALRPKILEQYPKYVEKILFDSMKKMKDTSKKGVIEYLLIVCRK